MPISSKHSCVFVHVPRTGGTTVEKLLGIHREWPDPHTDVFHGRWEIEGDTLQLQHLPYPEMQVIADLAFTREYFKFSFVRNPWDRLVSEYFWLAQQHRVAFEDFVSRAESIVRARTRIRGENCHFRPQSDFLSDDLDFVGRFENLEHDLHIVLDRLGVAYQAIPRHAGTQHARYTSLYEGALAERVADIYAQDIALLGYEFGR